MHRKNIFNQISHGSESERIYLEKIVNEEKVDPVTGEAHYYKCPVTRDLRSFNIKLPRDKHFAKFENLDHVKVVFPRAKDNYIVIKIE